MWKQLALNEAAMAVLAVNFPDMNNIEFVCIYQYVTAVYIYQYITSMVVIYLYFKILFDYLNLYQQNINLIN